MWTSTQRVKIGKHAAEQGNASAVRAMGLKYPGLKQQTVSDVKLACNWKKVRKLLIVTLQILP